MLCRRRGSAGERAAGHIDNPPGWLTTVTSRIALDRLRSAQHRRERYVGPWLPEIAGPSRSRMNTPRWPKA